MADKVQISALVETTGFSERDAEKVLKQLETFGLEIAPRLHTLHITKRHVRDGVYVGETDVSDWKGHIRLAEDLGIVQFNTTIRATGRIEALDGTGIKVNGGIEYGLSLETSLGARAKFICGRMPVTALRVCHRGPHVDRRQVA